MPNLCYMKGHIFVTVYERPNLCYMKGQIYVLRKAKFMLYERPNLCYMKG